MMLGIIRIVSIRVLAYDPKATSANIHDTTGAGVEIWKDFKTGRFWRHFLVAAFSAVGFFAAVLGLYDVRGRFAGA